MINKEIIQLLEQDIKDLEGLINHNKYCISNEILKNQTKGISLNIQEHLQELYNSIN